jgi:hypothetical protein
LPGSAFRNNSNQGNIGNQNEDEAEKTSSSKTIEWPVGISHRINNLFLLNADLNCELDEWLGQKDAPNIREEQLDV